MKILMVLEREFPADDRVEKEAISLTKAGHEVHLACYTFENRPASEKYKDIIIHRKSISATMFKLSALCLIFPNYFNFWRKFITSLFQKYSFDAIHIHDLPLAGIGIQMKRKFGCKLICDQHEYYSNWIIHTAHYNTLLGKVVKRMSKWKDYEQRTLSQADLVITIEEPLRQCYIKEVGIDPEKIILVPNTPLSSIFNHANVKVEIVERYTEKFILFYAGGIDRLRGIDMIIEALPLIKQKIPNVCLLLAGSISKGYDPFRKAKELNVSDRLDFVGWIDIRDMPSYIAASDVCFFTPPANRDEINSTIATKVYQYAAMGKPQLTSTARLMKEFVLSNKIGFSVQSAEEIDKVVNELKQNNELYKMLSENAILTAKKFTWESTIKPLVEFYANDQINS